MVLKVLTDGKISVSNLDYKLVAKTEGLNCDKNSSGSFTVNTTEGNKTEFDRLLQNRWETHMSKGHFRYGLDVLETRKVIHDGMYIFFSDIYIYLYIYIILSKGCVRYVFMYL